LQSPDACTGRLQGLPPAGTAGPSSPHPPIPARSWDTMQQETPPGLLPPFPLVEPPHLLNPGGKVLDKLGRPMAGACRASISSI